jgi:hypothetical protein
MTISNTRVVLGTLGYTNVVRDAFVSRAGADFTWMNAPGSMRPASDPRRGVRFELFNGQGGICPQCGESLGDYTSGYTLHVSHLVSRGNVKTSAEGKGWMPGNLALQHPACNTRQQANGPVVNPSDMVRPDLVVMEWSSRPALTILGKSIKDIY